MFSVQSQVRQEREKLRYTFVETTDHMAWAEFEGFLWKQSSCGFEMCVKIAANSI